MCNLDEDQTALKDTYDNLFRTNADDVIVDHLNLYIFAFKHKNRWTHSIY